MKKKNKKKYKYEIRDENGEIKQGPEIDAQFTPDYSKKCFVCGTVPIVPLTEMCGPCTFGEAETVGGNW